MAKQKASQKLNIEGLMAGVYGGLDKVSEILREGRGAFKDLREFVRDVRSGQSTGGPSTAEAARSTVTIEAACNFLGVTAEAPEEVVKAVYRARAKAAHPDAGGSEEQMMKVNAAYEVICKARGWGKRRGRKPKVAAK